MREQHLCYQHLRYQHLCYQHLCKQHLHDLDFTSIYNSDAAILVGTDFPQMYLYKDMRIRNDHEPIVNQSILGCVLLGGKDNNKTTISNNFFQSSENPSLDQTVENF